MSQALDSSILTVTLFFVLHYSYEIVVYQYLHFYRFPDFPAGPKAPWYLGATSLAVSSTKPGAQKGHDQYLLIESIND